MEHRSSEKAAASSNQDNQFQNEENLAPEVNPLLQYSTSQPMDNELSYRLGETGDFQQSNLDLLASLGSSMSRDPLRGEFMSPFNEAYQDLPAAYMPQSNDQIYNPLPTLPSEFYSLPSSSRLQGEHIGSSQPLGFGNSVLEPSTDVGVQMNAPMLEASLPFRPIGNQGINQYAMNTPSGFDLGSSSTTAREPTSSLKRKLPWEDEGSLSYRGWNSFGRGYQRYSSRNLDATGERFGLYDKRYQDMGLPVDPHLRIFNAIYGNGNNGESSNQKK